MDGEGPVKISRFAIDGKAPHSDLYVSPWHAIYLDSILIPAKYLVNGVTIVADAKPEALSLTYFHIELDTHEAILAEGLAVESFLRDDPHAFDNADEYVRLYGSPGEPLTPFAPYFALYRPPRVGITYPQRTRSLLRFPQADRQGPRPHFRSRRICPRCLIDFLRSKKSWTSLVRPVVPSLGQASWRTSTAVRVHKWRGHDVRHSFPFSA